MKNIIFKIIGIIAIGIIVYISQDYIFNFVLNNYYFKGNKTSIFDKTGTSSQKENGKSNNNYQTTLSNGAKLYQRYSLFSYGIKEAYITFYEQNKCIMDFSLFNGVTNMYGDEKLHIIYNDKTPCNYKVQNDKTISVSWNGTIDQHYEYKLGTGEIKSSIISSQYILPNGLILKYDEETQFLFTEGCTWESQGVQGDLTIITCNSK